MYLELHDVRVASRRITFFRVLERCDASEMCRWEANMAMWSAVIWRFNET